jgi:hypothetical protein
MTRLGTLAPVSTIGNVTALAALSIAAVASGCSESEPADLAGPSTAETTAASIPLTTADESGEGPSTSLDDSTDPDLGAIVHLLPDHLPEGWTVGHATERIENVELSDGTTLEVSDYTVVWRPIDDAGSSRDDSTDLGDGNPEIFLNLGSPYYSSALWLPESDLDELTRGPTLDAAEVTEADGYLHLEWVAECCGARLTGRGVSADELRLVAESLHPVPRADWRAAYGDRLLVDDQTDE